MVYFYLFCIFFILNYMAIRILGMGYNFVEYFYSLSESFKLSFVDIIWFCVDMFQIEVFVFEFLFKDYVVKRRLQIKLDR